MQPPRRSNASIRRRRPVLVAAFGAVWLGTVGLLMSPVAAAFVAATAVSVDPLAAPPPVGDPTAPIYVLTATGTVDNVMAGYIEEGVRKAAADRSPAMIVELNTPGGALDSTQRIVSALLEAPVPTIVWVAPSGGRAASAGTFITLSAHLAYMAPGTNIGAASPVGSGGEELTGTIGEKVRNDAVANIKAIAEARNRNVDWATSTVTDARSSPASEAVSLGAVNGIAVSLEDVRRKADGQVVDVQDAPATIDMGAAPFQDLAMNPFQSLLHLLSDPNVAFLLFSLGSLGLLFELQNPNFVTGILGAIAIILAFIGFGSLPLNVAGLLLIGLAAVLFLLETTVTSHGLLTIGGLICFVLGASALYTAPGTPAAPDVAVGTPLIVAMTITMAGFMALLLATVVRSRQRSRTYTAGAYGAGGSHFVPVGTSGIVKVGLAPTGIVHAAGEDWSARADAAVAPGAPVRVVGQEGLTLLVEPGPSEGPGEEEVP